MRDLKTALVTLARESGATAARVTTAERLAGPPSADPTYCLPGARSVVVFAEAFAPNFIPDYVGKVTRPVFKDVMYDTYRLLGVIGQARKAELEAGRFRAFTPTPNTFYRPDASTPHRLIPNLSHRYAALAAGLAAHGWSGGGLTPRHWVGAFYSSVITDDVLEPDEPLTEEVCDRSISRHRKGGYLNYCGFRTILPTLERVIALSPESPTAQQLSATIGKLQATYASLMGANGLDKEENAALLKQVAAYSEAS